MVGSRAAVGGLMKPAASAAPRGGAALAAGSVRRWPFCVVGGGLRGRPAFALGLGLRFAASCCWSGLRSGAGES